MYVCINLQVYFSFRYDLGWQWGSDSGGVFMGRCNERFPVWGGGLWVYSRAKTMRSHCSHNSKLVFSVDQYLNGSPCTDPVSLQCSCAHWELLTLWIWTISGAYLWETIFPSEVVQYTPATWNWFFMPPQGALCYSRLCMPQLSLHFRCGKWKKLYIEQVTPMLFHFSLLLHRTSCFLNFFLCIFNINIPAEWLFSK